MPGDHLLYLTLALHKRLPDHTTSDPKCSTTHSSHATQPIAEPVSTTHIARRCCERFCCQRSQTRTNPALANSVTNPQGLGSSRSPVAACVHALLASHSANIINQPRLCQQTKYDLCRFFSDGEKAQQNGPYQCPKSCASHARAVHAPQKSALARTDSAR